MSRAARLLDRLLDRLERIRSPWIETGLALAAAVGSAALTWALVQALQAVTS